MAVSPHGAVDPLFAAVAEQVYGPGVDVEQIWAVVKSMPGASDVHAPSDPKKEKRLAAIGLGATGVAGVGGLHALAGTHAEHKIRMAQVGGKPIAEKAVGPVTRGLTERLGPKKAAIAVTAGWSALHGVELVGDALAARAQAQNLKKKPATTVAKLFGAKVAPRVLPEALVHADARARRAGLRLVGATGVAAGAGGGYAAGRHSSLPVRRKPAPTGEVAKAGIYRNARRASQEAVKATEAGRQAAETGRQVVEDVAHVTGKLRRVKPQHAVAAAAAGGAGLGATQFEASYYGSKRGVRAGLKKSVDLEFRGEISKLDNDRRQAFGWANLAMVDGQPVVDLQGDYVSIEEIESSAYGYMLHSRVGGGMHQRIGKGVDLGPVHIADTIESFVVTPEKLEAMGLAPDALPLGWWIGQQINDEDAWQKVKRGEWTGFSIHGTGVRKEVLV